MSISVNGQSVVPPGFRFHPTEEELLTYYLKKKVASERIDLDVIRDVDLNKLEPWDIQERCRIGSGPQNDWYFFSHKDKKYPTGTRTNRATAAGFWKATGRDKAIYSSSNRIGMRKTLVFYKGRAPHGQKSDWIMHEYRLDDPSSTSASAAINLSSYYCSSSSSSSSPMRGDQTAQQEEGWVICRVFKKKNLVHNSGAGAAAKFAAAAMESSPRSNCSTVTTVNDQVKAAALTTSTMLHSSASDDALDHILNYMGRNCKHEPTNSPAPAIVDHHHQLAGQHAIYGGANKFMKLPPLEHVAAGGGLLAASGDYSGAGDASGIADWDTLDRLAASYELNVDVAKNGGMVVGGGGFFDVIGDGGVAGAGDGDLWSLARSVSTSLHADLTMNNV